MVVFPAPGFVVGVRAFGHAGERPRLGSCSPSGLLSHLTFILSSRDVILGEKNQAPHGRAGSAPLAPAHTTLLHRPLATRPPAQLPANRTDRTGRGKDEEGNDHGGGRKSNIERKCRQRRWRPLGPVGSLDEHVSWSKTGGIVPLVTNRLVVWVHVSITEPLTMSR